MQLGKNGVGIRSVDDWLCQAPPAKGKAHWKDNRSAKELAKAWFPASGDPVVPDELSRLFLSSPAVGLIEFESGEPEALVRFDDVPGEPRHSDLLLIGSCALGRIVVSIEAKADESFGQLGRVHTRLY